MSHALRILSRARNDVDSIFDWLQRRSPQGAAAWYEALLAAMRQISIAPTSFPIAAEASSKWSREIREALFKTKRGQRYRILFEVMAPEVLVLRIRGPGQPPIQARGLPRK